MTSQPLFNAPKLDETNTLIQINIIGDEHILVQKIYAFISRFGLLYQDSNWSFKDMYEKFPAVCFMAEQMGHSLT